MIKLTVNVEQAIDLAVESGRAAARRASMLMAYGLNASAEAANAGFHLPGFIQLVDAPGDLSPAQMEHFKADFRNWIVANGFQELLGGTETFLNGLYRMVISAERHLGRTRDGPAKKLIRKFERSGVSRKLDILERRYGFDTGFAHYFRSLTQARNCLAHRQGIVADEDCDSDGTFRLIWLGMDAMITESDGTKHFISPETLGPINGSKFSDGGNPQLTAMMVDRNLRFAKGNSIAVPARSLQEICTMTSYTCLKLRQLTFNWLLEQGITVNGGQPVPDPVATIFIDEIGPEKES